MLEARPGVGGLWRELPAWQDIQISVADWAIGDLPLAGPLQPQILANIEAWVERFALADGIRLNSPVRRARHDGSGWELDTPQGRGARAPPGGGQRRPQHAADSAVRRVASRVREWHASTLHDPQALAGRDVLVVGGGASAFDLIDQCLSTARGG